jgi:hypothetical protein
MTSHKTSIIPRIISASVLGTLTLLASVAQSANITWGAAQQISGSGDVSTTGALIGGFNVGGTGVPSTVVNGVTFQSFAAPGGNGSSGNFTMTAGGGVFDSNTGGASPNPPFSGLPAGYQTLLSSFVVPLFGPATLTMSGLVVGMQYQFQFWSNNSSDRFGYTITATAGNSVGLSSNTSFAEGGLGEWVIGSFTADAATQQITFSGDGDGGFLNGFQLRQLVPPTNQVPETGSSLALLAGAMAGLALLHRSVSRKPSALS